MVLGTRTSAPFTWVIPARLRHPDGRHEYSQRRPHLAYNAGSSGSYTLGGGTLSVTGTEYIGYYGTGTFTQTGGTNTVYGNLDLGYNAGSSGSYTLGGGTLSVTGESEQIGCSGSGIIHPDRRHAYGQRLPCLG